MEQSNDNLITTVEEFIKEVSNVINSFTGNNRSDLFWFRGESDSDFKNPLSPGSYRSLAQDIGLRDLKCDARNIKEIENILDAEFFRKGHQYLKELNIKDNQLNRYFIMQHYGIPTRLLDWSENALVALFFAVNSTGIDDKRSVVYVLQPYLLNNYTLKEILETKKEFNKIPTIVNIQKKKNLLNEDNELRIDELYRRYLKMDFCDEKSYYPLAILPPPLEKRMLMQSGCFTIFGNEIKGLLSHNNSKGYLRKLVIQEGKKKEILKQLDHLGINENSIYSDLDGLGNYLKRKYSAKYRENFSDLQTILSNFQKK